MAKGPIKYGVINEDCFTLRSPRSIDGDEHDTLAEALKEAAEMIGEGMAEQVSVVRCRYSLKHGVWFEVPDGGCIQIDSCNWKHDDEEAA